MNSRESWANWKHHLTVQELSSACLQTEKKDDLMRSLVNTIFEKYPNQKDPTDFITPLIHFIRAIENETRYIDCYIILAKALKRSGLIRFFPTSKAKLEQAIAAKERIIFAKRLFTIWNASQNAQHFYRAAHRANMGRETFTERMQERYEDYIDYYHLKREQICTLLREWYCKLIKYKEKQLERPNIRNVLKRMHRWYTAQVRRYHPPIQRFSMFARNSCCQLLQYLKGNT